MIDFEKLKEKGIEKDDLELNVNLIIDKKFELENNDFYSVMEENLMFNNQKEINFQLKNFVFFDGDDTTEEVMATLEVTLYEAPIVFSPIDEYGNFKNIPDMHEIFDMHSAELGELMFYLTKETDYQDCYNSDLIPKKNNFESWELNLLYINKIKVKEEYQNCGIGSYFLENIEKLLYEKLHEKCHFIAICPAHYSERREDLKKLYRKYGFRTYRNSEFMVKKNTLYNPYK